MANGIGLPAGEVVEAFKALASPMRWQILEWLRDPEGQFAQWEPIADLCGGVVPSASHPWRRTMIPALT